MSISFWQAALGSLGGSIGFALLAHAPIRSLLPSGCIAVLSFLIYWVLTSLGLSESLAVFAGSLAGALAGHWVSRRMKMISTVFLMSAIVPVVPGLGLYRTMSLLAQGLTSEGADQGIRAMITIAMISLGLGAGSFIDRRSHHHRSRDLPDPSGSRPA